MNTILEQYARTVLYAFIISVCSFIFIWIFDKNHSFSVISNKDFGYKDYNVTSSPKYEQFGAYTPIALDPKYVDIPNSVIQDPNGVLIDSTLTIISIPIPSVNNVDFRKFVALSSDYEYETTSNPNDPNGDPIPDLRYRYVSTKYPYNPQTGEVDKNTLYNDVSKNYYLVKYWIKAKKKGESEFKKYVVYYYFQTF